MARSKQFAVLGLGRFGSSVARTLTDNGFSVLCIDNNADIVQSVSEFATHAVQADVSDEAVLRSLGLGNFDVVVIAIGSNMESSIMSTLIAKELGAKFVVAKATNFTQKTILQKVGADRIVMPERDMGYKVARGLISANIIDTINISDEISIIEVEPPASWINKSISHSNIRVEYGFNIVALKRGNKVIVSPKADEVIAENDIVLVIGENSAIERLEEETRHA